MTKKEILAFIDALSQATSPEQRNQLMKAAGIDPRIFNGRQPKEVIAEIDSGLRATNYDDLSSPISKQVFLRSQGVDANGIPLYYGGGLIDGRFENLSTDAESKYKSAMANNDWLYTRPAEEEGTVDAGVPNVSGQEKPSYSDANGNGVPDEFEFSMDQNEYDAYMDAVAQKSAEYDSEQAKKQSQYENTKGAAGMMSRFLNNARIYSDARGRLSALRQQENSLAKPQYVQSAPNAGLQDAAYDAGAMQGQGIGATANASLRQSLLENYGNEDQKRMAVSGGQAGLYGLPQQDFSIAQKIAAQNAQAEGLHTQGNLQAQGAYGADLQNRGANDFDRFRITQGRYDTQLGKIKSAESQAQHNKLLAQNLMTENAANMIPEFMNMNGVDWNALRNKFRRNEAAPYVPSEETKAKFASIPMKQLPASRNPMEEMDSSYGTPGVPNAIPYQGYYDPMSGLDYLNLTDPLAKYRR